MLLGEALDGLDRTSQAIEEFAGAARIAPHQPNVHFGLGYLYWKQRKFDQAEEEFGMELQNGPVHARSLAYLGDVYFRRRDFESSERLLLHALKLEPNIGIAYVDLGAIHSSEKQF
jgi:tetratricopeptide (TPR) repeat protein